MRYVKSFLVGLIGAVTAVMAVIVGNALVSSIWFAMEASRSAGSGGIGAVSAGVPVWIAPLGFVAGLWWQLRRSRRRASR